VALSSAISALNFGNSVWNAAAAAEAAGDLFADLRQQPDVLRLHSEVVRASRRGQPGRVLGWQDEGHRRREMFEERPGGHRRQPLAHVTLAETGRPRDLGARGLRRCRHVSNSPVR
jgi:hypothetical protein